MEDCIHLIDKNKGEAPSGFVTNVTGEVGYTIGAKKIATQIEVGATGQERLEDNPSCYCKFIMVGDEPVFYIRADMANNFVNPWDSITSISQANRLARQTGKPAWVYKKVSKACFELYLKFLDTRNVSYLRICERDSKDG